MSFFKVDRSIKPDKSKKGIVYVLAIELTCGSIVVKVGMSTRKVHDRIPEVLTSFYHQYRYYPKCTPCRFKEVDDPFAVEAYLHKAFKESKYSFDKKFDGSTEFFAVGVEEVISKYDETYLKYK